MDYVRGLQVLKNSLPQDKMAEFQVYEARLLENLHRERLYGSTPTSSADRMVIIDQLNQLARTYHGLSFTELCYNPQITTVNTVSSAPRAATSIAGTLNNAQEKPAEQGKFTPPRVAISLLTSRIPTAYYHHLNVNDFPLVTVTINNIGSGCDDASLTVSTFIEDFSDTSTLSVEVSEGEEKRVSLLPLLKRRSVATLNEIQRGTLHTSIKQLSPKKSTLHDQTDPIHLHARNTALLAIEAQDGSIRDLTKYLVAWVTPHTPRIEKMLRKAIEHHRHRSFVGYGNASTLAESTSMVREQVQAFFETLRQEANLVYADSPISLGSEYHQVMQRVRLPGEILESGGLANCLEGTVLFASLLELISIEPLIVLIPQHAFVGWRVASGIDRYEFLETTLMSDRNIDFPTAQREAQRAFDDAQFGGYFDRELFDPRGFARLIDVFDSRQEEIYPLE